MPTDVLHLLLKGVLHRCIGWLGLKLDELIPREHHQHKRNIHIRQVSGSEQLDYRFGQLVTWTGKDAIYKFSERKQWTGKEQKVIASRLVAVITPLVQQKAPGVILFIRAVCDLVLFAFYRHHDKETLAYIETAIQRIHTFKEEFRELRIKRQTKVTNFTFAKWHALTHITDDIRYFGSLDGLDTGSNDEAFHSTMVKKPWEMSNKHDFEKQICLENSRRTTLLALEHLIAHERLRLRT